MPEYTSDSTVITQALIDILETNRDLFGLRGIYYGDQALIPEYPAACVESFPKERSLTQAGMHFDIILRSGVFVYFGKIQSSEINKKEVEELTEKIEKELNKHNTLNDRIVFGYVSRVEPGVAVKNNVMLRAARITWEAISKEVVTGG